MIIRPLRTKNLVTATRNSYTKTSNHLYELTDDIALIDSLKRNERAGYQLLYDSYSPSIYGIIKKIIEKETVAEAILTATFVEVSNAILEYDPDKQRLYTWLVNITPDLCFKKLRALKADPNHEAELNKSKLQMIYFDGKTVLQISNELKIPLDVVKRDIRIEVKAPQLSIL